MQSQPGASEIAQQIRPLAPETAGSQGFHFFHSPRARIALEEVLFSGIFTKHHAGALRSRKFSPRSI